MGESTVNSVDNEMSFDLFGTPDFFHDKERPYTQPRWLTNIPRFDLDDVRALLTALHQSAPIDAFVANRYYMYRLAHIWARLGAAIWLLCSTVGLGIYFAGDRLGHLDPWMRQNLLRPMLAGLIPAVAFCVAATVWNRIGVRNRFFRLIHRAETQCNFRLPNSVYVVNLAGRAARCLFKAMQGGRRTWVSPPAVSDRALVLAYPIVNVDISRCQDALSEYYGRFLHDVAALAMLGHEHLIPRLREAYLLLPARESDDGAVPERDALYLDPMRNYHRWAVVKDYLYPLASWLSFLLAVVALVISIAN